MFTKYGLSMVGKHTNEQNHNNDQISKQDKKCFCLLIHGDFQKYYDHIAVYVPGKINLKVFFKVSDNIFIVLHSGGFYLQISLHASLDLL